MPEVTTVLSNRWALAIREHVLGPEHSHVANNLNSLAELYRAQSADAEAEPFYQRARVPLSAPCSTRVL